jgi:hypothetical protein
MRACTAIIAAFFLPLAVNAQEPPASPEKIAVLQNTGKPMLLDFRCTEDDLHLTALTCTAEHPCPVYLEVSSVGPLGAKIFVAGNLHTPSTTLSSVLLASDDSGKNWREPHGRIRAAVLEQIQFIDFEKGWIAGYVMNTFPHDPFLLLTSDGGSTWRRRPVTGENRIGIIDRFWFDSRDRGILWLDRSQAGEAESQYERYESMTGGESWMLREVSDRPIPKTDLRPESSPNWRIRADAATQSYRVERREGERWNAAASFLIKVGECKPTEKPQIEVTEPEEPSPASVSEPSPEPAKPSREPPTLRRKK